MGDLTRSQISVLLRLEREGPTTTSDLARAEGMRPQSMAAIVTALKAQDLIVGSAHPGDGRKVILSLSESAREQFLSGRRAREDWLFNAIRSELRPGEIADLNACVPLLARLTSFP